jgi:cytosine/adenosine deaminase-related metal-dependent hydrolase
MKPEVVEFIRNKPEIVEFIRNLRSEGYAVVFWTPHELRGVDPELVEDMSIQYGNDVIDMNVEEE